jgi:hypothetical protein
MNTRLRLWTGMALMLVGLVRLVAGPGSGPLTGWIHGWPGVVVGTLLVAGGWLLYRSACPT